MVIGLFKSLMGQKAPTPPAAGPLGLRIGAAVEIDTLRFRMMAKQLNFDLPNDTLFITAHGHVDLGDGSHVHRYYTDAHTMFQILCVGGQSDAHVQEVTLYVPHTSYYPEGQAWQTWQGEGARLGQPSYSTDDGTLYQRIWFEDDGGWASPVRFQEQVTHADNAVTLIGQEVMLYGRQIAEGPGFGEYLLLSIEEHPEGRSVEAMLGVDLEPGMFTVI